MNDNILHSTTLLMMILYVLMSITVQYTLTILLLHSALTLHRRHRQLEMWNETRNEKRETMWNYLYTIYIPTHGFSLPTPKPLCRQRTSDEILPPPLTNHAPNSNQSGRNILKLSFTGSFDSICNYSTRSQFWLAISRVPKVSDDRGHKKLEDEISSHITEI